MSSHFGAGANDNTFDQIKPLTQKTIAANKLQLDPLPEAATRP